jgi:lysophospholipid acyltransferase (LPLAT)-like uncharacterized protein
MQKCERVRLQTRQRGQGEGEGDPRLTFRIRVIAVLLAAAVRALYPTLRVTVRREAEVEALRREYGGLILVTWHGRSLVPIARCRGRGYLGLVSLSRDGDLLSAFFRRMGWRAVRGSSGRRGVRAAKAAVDALEGGGTDGAGAVLAVTPDGPRGPARKVQPGAVFFAQKSGKPLVAVGIGASRAWHARSWDRFLIPKPFSRVVWLYGGPIFVGPEDDLAETCHRIETEINTLEAQAEAEAHAAGRSGRRRAGTTAVSG